MSEEKMPEQSHCVSEQQKVRKAGGTGDHTQESQTVGPEPVLEAVETCPLHHTQLKSARGHKESWL